MSLPLEWIAANPGRIPSEGTHLIRRSRRTETETAPPSWFTAAIEQRPQHFDVEVDGHEIAVKFGLFDGEVVNAKPEHRDCVRVAKATGRSVKSVWAQALGAAQSQSLFPAVAD